MVLSQSDEEATNPDNIIQIYLPTLTFYGILTVAPEPGAGETYHFALLLSTKENTNESSLIRNDT